MIAGIFHSGSGLGNQLHRYIATRVLALDKGYEFSMVAPENFKGKSFMNLDMGKFPIDKSCYYTEYPSGKVVANLGMTPWEEKTSYYNPEFNFIEDNTIIDGDFQDERYFEHRLAEVDEWLRVDYLDVPDDVCVIGFRGGEYYMYPELGLPVDYFYKGIGMVKSMLAQQGKQVKFEVHTDDVELAKKFFPDTSLNTFKIIHDIGVNWRSMRCAKYAIIANSSFYILPRIMRHSDHIYQNTAVTIAPRYWARRNTKEWIFPQNYYKSFKYI